LGEFRFQTVSYTVEAKNFRQEEGIPIRNVVLYSVGCFFSKRDNQSNEWRLIQCKENFAI
jgi:hypothetical protein